MSYAVVCVCVPASVYVCVFSYIWERERELKGGIACTEGFQSWLSFVGQSVAEYSSQSWLIVDETVVGVSLTVFAFFFFLNKKKKVFPLFCFFLKSCYWEK